MKRSALLLVALLALAGAARALDPLPNVETGPGFSTWTLEADHPLLKLEDAMADLRSADPIRHAAVLQALGIKKEMQGRELKTPDIAQPIEATTQFLSFERRKLAILTAPIRGRDKWYAVVLREEGNGEAYWRARQVFLFVTDPVAGIGQSFPDILGDDIRFWEVEHSIKDDIYGRAQVSSIFKWDEIGRMRLTYQEISDGYRTAKFQGQALRLEQRLVFKGDQKIVRELDLRTYPWMKREEFEHYLGVKAKDATPAKVQHLKESFAWDPADFNFYDAAQELEKLVRNKSPFIRAEAARRLGEHLKTAHPQLAAAAWKDKDPMVRIQVALALKAIADPSALPALDKALANWDEDDSVRQALQEAKDSLEAVKAAQGGPAPDPAGKGD
jgi:hypothetical protein